MLRSPVEMIVQYMYATMLHAQTPGGADVLSVVQAAIYILFPRRNVDKRSGEKKREREHAQRRMRDESVQKKREAAPRTHA